MLEPYKVIVQIKLNPHGNKVVKWSWCSVCTISKGHVVAAIKGVKRAEIWLDWQREILKWEKKVKIWLKNILSLKNEQVLLEVFFSLWRISVTSFW